VDRDRGATTVEPGLKGFGPGASGRPLSDLLADRPSLFGGLFAPPVAVLHRGALTHNIATMARYCRDNGVDLAPHGKTSMAPQLFRRQLDAGAWAMTAATPAHVAVYRAAGVRRILLANELVEPAWIDWIVAELAEDACFDFLCYVDSVAGVQLLADRLGRLPLRRLDVLIEMGHAKGRTGCRTLDEARVVARAAADVEGLRVVGLGGYEGSLGHDISPQVLASVDEYLSAMHSAAADLAAEDLLEDPGGGIVLSAGGSVHFDRVVAVLARPLPDGRPSRCVLRSGCYVTHDSGEYARLSPFSRPGADPAYAFRPALEVWASVLSVPEPGLAIAGMGKRDTGIDMGLPVPTGVRRGGGPAGAAAGAEPLAGSSVAKLNDQHAYVSLAPGITVEPGDWMSFGISHPCSTFERWRLLPEVDDDYRVVDFIETFF
jgi:D-serine deaminase-like pyridoxal phosphate-dependent protein